MRKVVLPVFLLFLFVAALPFQGYSAEPTYPISTDVKTTRERTVSPASLTQAQPELKIDQVDQYDTIWIQFMGVGSPCRLRPAFTGRLHERSTYTPVETLLTFFSMSDIHITDKESPAQAIYSGVDRSTFWTTPTPRRTHLSCCLPPTSLTQRSRRSTSSTRPDALRFRHIPGRCGKQQPV